MCVLTHQIRFCQSLKSVNPRGWTLGVNTTGAAQPPSKRSHDKHILKLDSFLKDPLAGRTRWKGNGWNMGRFLENRKRMDLWWCDFVTLGGKKRFNQWIEKKSQNSVSLRSSGSWIKSSRFGRLLGKMLKKMICRTFLLIVVIKKYTPWN